MRNVSREEGIWDARYKGESVEAPFLDESGVPFT